MKSNYRSAATAMSVFAGIFSQYAYAATPVLAAQLENAVQGNGKPMPQLVASLHGITLLHQSMPPMHGSHAASFKLAMEMNTAGTYGTGTSTSAGQSGSRTQTESQALLEKYSNGAYLEVGKEGIALLEKDPNNAELRFAVANSLAWTGFISEAAQQYNALAGTNYHDQALIGLGNVNRWSGRPDKAAQAYRQVLQRDPDNLDARSGLLLASRELRPVSAAKIGRAGNSDDSDRTWTTLSHAWRDNSGATRQEITVGRLEESNHQADLVQRDLSWRYDNLDALVTQAELAVQESPATRLFGAITLRPAGTPLQIHIGHINWGKLAFNPLALQSGLTANRIGADFSYRYAPGNVRLTYNAYRISDDNLVQDASAQITPAIQPFGSSPLRAFLGVEARKSRFNDPRYWSPEEGQYTALVGVSADWSNQWWQTSGSVQYGAPLTGESGRTWSAGFGVKRWLSESWAVIAEAWAIHTPRDGGYRAHSGSIRLEKLW
jgi:tetratricopeptide (TPR) repeat protein